MAVSIFNRLPPRGRVYRFRKLIFWAQGGQVCIEDEGMEGDFRLMSSAEFAARLIAFKQCLARHVYNYPSERAEAENFVTNGVACVNEAYKQGDPADPKVFEELRAERRRSIFYTGTGVAAPTNREVSEFGLRQPPANGFHGKGLSSHRQRPQDNSLLPAFQGTKGLGK